MDKIKQFKAAYDSYGHSYVLIHELRKRLGWDKSEFDTVLNELRHSLKIQLQGGDPSIMTEQEIRDSFTDEKNRLRICLTWRG